MVLLEHQSQILDGVIGWVLVDVVDHLIVRQVATDMSLHHQSVLHHIPLRITERVIGVPSGAVPAARPVSDETATPNHTDARRRLALAGAVDAGAPSELHVATAFGARVGGSTPPAILDVAGPTAEPRDAAVLGGVAVPALLACPGDCPRSHHPNLPQERYCEIAAKRCAQEVLAL